MIIIKGVFLFLCIGAFVGIGLLIEGIMHKDELIKRKGIFTIILSVTNILFLLYAVCAVQ